ncbi:MAG: hypothetical protein AAB250_03090 [Bdellovibrionota bacterium]
MQLRSSFQFFVVSFALCSCASLPNQTDKMCTVDRAHYAGMAGWDYSESCGIEDPELRVVYERGRERVVAEGKLAAARQEQEAERKRVDEDQSVVNHIGTFFNVVSTGSTTPQEDAHVRDSKAEVATVTEGVGVSPGFRTPVTDTAGGMLGPAMSLVVGFGTGQLVQSRWMEEGWKWTAADVGLIAGIVVSAKNCDTGDACASAPGALALGLLVSRIFQTVETSREFSRRSKLRVSPVATSSSDVAPGLTMSLGF